jgi:HSP20 family protein
MANIVRADPFEDLFRGFFLRPVQLDGGFMEAAGMKVDVSEDNDHFTIHAELPGIKKEDIHVHVDGSVVSITAERKKEHEVKDSDRVLRSERSFGQISRSFDLGMFMDESKASAKFTDGILELSLPKKTAPKAKQLHIV